MWMNFRYLFKIEMKRNKYILNYFIKGVEYNVFIVYYLSLLI